MKDVIAEIQGWFEQAVPVVTDRSKSVQLGCHFEEVSEMMEALADGYESEVLNSIAEDYKRGDLFDESAIDRKELLDALCDQIVTAIGVAHMFGFDIQGALAEVSASNTSKFVDGKPIFNAQGKIQKGPGYFKPNLEPFLKRADKAA